MGRSTPGIPHPAAGCTPRSTQGLVKKGALGALSRGMIERIKQSWRRFKASKPGHRFQDSYRHRQQSSQGRFSVRRIFNIVLGSLLVVGSAFLGWLPGPGILTFFLGLALIAGELSPVARLLDWAEVGLRKLARPAKNIWDRSSAAGKTVIVVAIAVCVLALAYGAYSLLFG